MTDFDDATWRYTSPYLAQLQADRGSVQRTLNRWRDVASGATFRPFSDTLSMSGSPSISGSTPHHSASPFPREMATPNAVYFDAEGTRHHGGSADDSASTARQRNTTTEASPSVAPTSNSSGYGLASAAPSISPSVAAAPTPNTMAQRSAMAASTNVDGNGEGKASSAAAEVADSADRPTSRRGRTPSDQMTSMAHRVRLGTAIRSEDGTPPRGRTVPRTPGRASSSDAAVAPSTPAEEIVFEREKLRTPPPSGRRAAANGSVSAHKSQASTLPSAASPPLPRQHSDMFGFPPRTPDSHRYFHALRNLKDSPDAAATNGATGTALKPPSDRRSSGVAGGTSEAVVTSAASSGIEHLTNRHFILVATARLRDMPSLADLSDEAPFATTGHKLMQVEGCDIVRRPLANIGGAGDRLATTSTRVFNEERDEVASSNDDEDDNDVASSAERESPSRTFKVRFTDEEEDVSGIVNVADVAQCHVIERRVAHSAESEALRTYLAVTENLTNNIQQRLVAQFPRGVVIANDNNTTPSAFDRAVNNNMSTTVVDASVDDPQGRAGLFDQNRDEEALWNRAKQLIASTDTDARDAIHSFLETVPNCSPLARRAMANVLGAMLQEAAITAPDGTPARASTRSASSAQATAAEIAERVKALRSELAVRYSQESNELDQGNLQLAARHRQFIVAKLAEVTEMLAVSSRNAIDHTHATESSAVRLTDESLQNFAQSLTAVKDLAAIEQVRARIRDELNRRLAEADASLQAMNASLGAKLELNADAIRTVSAEIDAAMARLEAHVFERNELMKRFVQNFGAQSLARDYLGRQAMVCERTYHDAAVALRQRETDERAIEQLHVVRTALRKQLDDQEHVLFRENATAAQSLLTEAVVFHSELRNAAATWMEAQLANAQHETDRIAAVKKVIEDATRRYNQVDRDNGLLQLREAEARHRAALDEVLRTESMLRASESALITAGWQPAATQPSSHHNNTISNGATAAASMTAGWSVALSPSRSAARDTVVTSLFGADVFSTAPQADHPRQAAAADSPRPGTAPRPSGGAATVMMVHAAVASPSPLEPGASKVAVVDWASPPPTHASVSRSAPPAPASTDEDACIDRCSARDIVSLFRRPQETQLKWLMALEKMDIVCGRDLRDLRATEGVWSTVLLDLPMLKSQIELMLTQPRRFVVVDERSGRNAAALDATAPPLAENFRREDETPPPSRHSTTENRQGMNTTDASKPFWMPEVSQAATRGENCGQPTTHVPWAEIEATLNARSPDVRVREALTPVEVAPRDKAPAAGPTTAFAYRPRATELASMDSERRGVVSTHSGEEHSEHEEERSEHEDATNDNGEFAHSEEVATEDDEPDPYHVGLFAGHYHSPSVAAAAYDFLRTTNGGASISNPGGVSNRRDRRDSDDNDDDGGRAAESESRHFPASSPWMPRPRQPPPPSYHRDEAAARTASGEATASAAAIADIDGDDPTESQQHQRHYGNGLNDDDRFTTAGKPQRAPPAAGSRQYSFVLPQHHLSSAVTTDGNDGVRPGPRADDATYAPRQGEAAAPAPISFERGWLTRRGAEKRTTTEAASSTQEPLPHDSSQGALPRRSSPPNLQYRTLGPAVSHPFLPPATALPGQTRVISSLHRDPLGAAATATSDPFVAATTTIPSRRAQLPSLATWAPDP